MTCPSVRLHNGYSVPAVGLGTSRNTSEEIQKAVYHALQFGYRHVDTAHVYKNSDIVGAGLRAAIRDDIVRRDEVFVTGKLWNTFHAYDDVEVQLRKDLDEIGLDYFDLYLVHFPIAFERLESDVIFPMDSDGNVLTTDVEFTETWAALEQCVRKGLVRSIGLSNFSVSQIQQVLDMCKIQPGVLQCEAHPFLQQTELVDFCKTHDIVFTAYSPLVSPERIKTQSVVGPSIFDVPLLAELSHKYKKTVAQFVLKWLIQRGVTVIPKSVTASRIEENFNLFDFEISNEDMERVKQLDAGFRAVNFRQFPSIAKHKFNPFND